MKVVSWVFLLIAGWLVGAIVNWLADQLPALQKPTSPRCIYCQQKVSLGRYLTLERCRECGKKRSIRSWVIQILIPGLTLVLFMGDFSRIHPAIDLFILSYFLLVSVIDIEHRLILGPVSVVGFIIGSLSGIYIHDFSTTLIGGLAGGGIMWLLYQLGRIFSRWMSARRGGEPIDEEALGFGDVYVAVIIGLILGWPGITIGLFAAILAGGLVSGVYLASMFVLKRYQPFTALPYAPFLLVATIVLIYWN